MITQPNETCFTEGLEQFAAFQKLWLNSLSRLTQAALSFSPHSAPPEMLREVRDAILKSMTQEWDTFMRSPQFLEGMRQLLEGAISTRQAVNKLATHSRHETQGAALEDIDAIMLAVRHLETRLLERFDLLQGQITALTARLEAIQVASGPARSPSQAPRRRRQSGPRAAVTPASPPKSEA